MKTEAAKRLTMRKPSEEDGAAMWKLVRDSGVLDQNSAYAYLMYCKFFADTCVIAEWEDEVVGFVTAFCPPTAPDTVFVWQIGVNKQQRGMGVGSKMLRELLQRESCKQVRYLEATVSPSNLPSASLFRKAARELGAPCEVTECFPADLFPGETHETELTFRIGPFKGKQ